MMSVDDTLMCSFQILKPAEKKQTKFYSNSNSSRPGTPPRIVKVGIHLRSELGELVCGLFQVAEGFRCLLSSYVFFCLCISWIEDVIESVYFTRYSWGSLRADDCGFASES